MVKSVISKLEEKDSCNFQAGKSLKTRWKRAEYQAKTSRTLLERWTKSPRKNRESKENKDLALSEDEVLLSSSSPYPYPYPYQTQLEKKTGFWKEIWNSRNSRNSRKSQMMSRNRFGVILFCTEKKRSVHNRNCYCKLQARGFEGRMDAWAGYDRVVR